MCTCVLGQEFFISWLVLWDKPPGRSASIWQGAFQTGQTNVCRLVLQIPDLIVHLLCINVICQVTTATYSIKIRVCESMWACWLPVCCCVKTFQCYWDYFWGIVCCCFFFLHPKFCSLILFLFFFKRELWSNFILDIYTHHSLPSWLSTKLASKYCQCIVV